MNTKIQVLRSKNGLIFDDETASNGSVGWIWREGDFVEMIYYSRGKEQEWITRDEYVRRKKERKSVEASFLKIQSKRHNHAGNFNHIFDIQSL